MPVKEKPPARPVDVYLYNYFKERESGMAYVYYNPNPSKKLVGDCVIRGISILTNQSWKLSCKL